MNRLLVISFAVVFPFLGVLAASEQKPRQQPNRPPSIDSFTSSLTKVEVCPFLTQVKLVVNATDPDGDSLNYEYSIASGTISGKGKSVLWDLRGLPRMPHEVRVTVTDGKGGKVDAALTVTTADATGCDPPPCPMISVSCPDEMDKSRLFTVSAFIEGGPKLDTPASFNWKINAGRIVKGQNSHEMEVSTTGANGFDTITATVRVGGFDPLCHTVASCTTKIIW